MFREAFMFQFSYSMEIEDLNCWLGQLSAGGFIMMPGPGMALAFTSGLDDLCPVAYRRLPGPMSLFHPLEQQQGPEPGFSHLRFLQDGPTSTWFVVHYPRQVLYRPTSTEDRCFCRGLMPIRGPLLAQLQGESLTANQTEWMFSCRNHAVGRNSLC